MRCALLTGKRLKTKLKNRQREATSEKDKTIDPFFEQVLQKAGEGK